MSDSEDARFIFPIVDRPAPLLDRIREDDKTEPAGQFGEKLGREMVMLSQLTGDELEEVQDSIVDGMVRGVSKSTGLEENEVNRDSVREIAESLFNEESRLVNLPEELTIEELEGDEEEDDDSFSSEEDEE